MAASADAPNAVVPPSSHAPAPPPGKPRPSLLPPPPIGSIVRACNLAASRVELNGVKGVVVAPLSDEDAAELRSSGRVNVQFHGEPRPVAMLPSNLVTVLSTEVESFEGAASESSHVAAPTLGGLSATAAVASLAPDRMVPSSGITSTAPESLHVASLTTADAVAGAGSSGLPPSSPLPPASPLPSASSPKTKASDGGEWVEKASVRTCACCSAAFSIILWKHHCRACGNVVCEFCGPVVYDPGEKREVLRRVCRSCKDARRVANAIAASFLAQQAGHVEPLNERGSLTTTKAGGTAAGALPAE